MYRVCYGMYIEFAKNYKATQSQKLKHLHKLFFTKEPFQFNSQKCFTTSYNIIHWHSFNRERNWRIISVEVKLPQNDDAIPVLFYV